MREADHTPNLKHANLNRVSLFCPLLLASIISWRCGLAVAGYRSWNGIPTALLVLGIMTILVYLQARLSAGLGLRQLWKQCFNPAPQNQKLNFIDGSLIFIYIMALNGYIIYLAILD